MKNPHAVAEINPQAHAINARTLLSATWTSNMYDAVSADQEYRRDLVDYREGIDLTTDECDSIAQVIAPLLKQVSLSTRYFPHTLRLLSAKERCTII